MSVAGQNDGVKWMTKIFSVAEEKRGKDRKKILTEESEGNDGVQSLN